MALLFIIFDPRVRSNGTSRTNPFYDDNHLPLFICTDAIRIDTLTSIDWPRSQLTYRRTDRRHTAFIHLFIFKMAAHDTNAKSTSVCVCVCMCARVCILRANVISFCRQFYTWISQLQPWRQRRRLARMANKCIVTLIKFITHRQACYRFSFLSSRCCLFLTAATAQHRICAIVRCAVCAVWALANLIYRHRATLIVPNYGRLKVTEGISAVPEPREV